MFSDTITPDEQAQLENSTPVYSPLTVTSYCKLYMYRFLHKDTEDFEDIWRLNGTVPQRETFFYQQFPKKATSLDNEHHHSNFSMYGYCSRWLPLSVVAILFPFQRLIYVPDDNYHISRKLTLKVMPTAVECQMCEELKGFGIWDRKGNWCCVKREVLNNFDMMDHDEMGYKFFRNFEEYQAWRKFLRHKIDEYIDSTRDQPIDEAELMRLQEFRKHSNIPKDVIVEY